MNFVKHQSLYIRGLDKLCYKHVVTATISLAAPVEPWSLSAVERSRPSSILGKAPWESWGFDAWDFSMVFSIFSIDSDCLMRNKIHQDLVMGDATFHSFECVDLAKVRDFPLPKNTLQNQVLLNLYNLKSPCHGPNVSCANVPNTFHLFIGFIQSEVFLF